MMNWLTFLGGAFVGGVFAVFLLSLCAVAGEERRSEEDRCGIRTKR